MRLSTGSFPACQGLESPRDLRCGVFSRLSANRRGAPPVFQGTFGLERSHIAVSGGFRGVSGQVRGLFSALSRHPAEPSVNGNRKLHILRGGRQPLSSTTSSARAPPATPPERRPLAADEVLTLADGSAVTAGEAVERLLGAQIALRNNRCLETAMRTSRLPTVKAGGKTPGGAGEARCLLPSKCAIFGCH